MVSPDGEDSDFEPVPIDSACPHCRAGAPQPLAGIDAIYCISLREQPARATSAMAHFHALGLCRSVLMYRPRRGVFVTMSIWRSHRALAQHAGRHGHQRILAFEDDVSIDTSPALMRERIASAIDHLPEGWWGLFLGHFPFQAYRVAPGVSRARSGCLHAYIANAPMLRWLRETEPMDPTVSTSWLGDAIDSAVANLPEMYALDPMIATQRRFDDMRPDTAADRRGAINRAWWRGWRDRTFVYSLMRPGAFMVGLAGPLHRLTLERLRLADEAKHRDALMARASGLFDDAWYLQRYPDIAAADVHPLAHYMGKGAFEGRWPNAAFNTDYYLSMNPEVKRNGLNPLVHYITRGAREGANPNPDFDSAAYLIANPDVARAGLNPLAHFLANQRQTA